jgi:hypothetical protein
MRPPNPADNLADRLVSIHAQGGNEAAEALLANVTAGGTIKQMTVSVALARFRERTSQ